MPFPLSKRVIYQKNPLEQVVAQLRFPSILRIDSEVPVAFQEHIQSVFPNYEEKIEWGIELPGEIQAPVSSEVLHKSIQSSFSKNHEFTTNDGALRINLTRSFLALTAKNYRQWEEFYQVLHTPFRALEEIYKPTHFTRVGLRYVDIFRRSILGLTNTPWKELLNPSLLGMLASPDLYEAVENVESKHELRLGRPEGKVRIKAGYVQHVQDEEICFRVDSDFFIEERSEGATVLEWLTFFNSRASRLIQWSISPLLHNAMEPKEIV